MAAVPEVASFLLTFCSSPLGSLNDDGIENISLAELEELLHFLSRVDELLPLQEGDVIHKVLLE